MKKKVLVLTNFVAGLYSFRREVMDAIIDKGYELYISLPDVDDERTNYFEDKGCHIIKTEFNRRGTNPLDDLKLMLTYRKMMNCLKPFAVLSYTIKPNIYGGIACRITNTPQLANVTGLGDAMENGGWLEKLTVNLYRYGIGKAKKVFFQNSANREFCIMHGIANESSTILPGSGVNLKYHTVQDYPIDGIIKFLYIARLQRDKGVREFFDAAKDITSKNRNVEFQVLGWSEGDFQQEMEELNRRGIVKYLGKTSDIRPFLKEVHCTVMPSYHEGMSNVNLESAANGRPVITTNVSGCRETVDDGKTGFLVEAKNSRSLIEAIERFIELPYDKKVLMGKEGRVKVEREFDREIVVKAYLDALETIDN